MNAVLTRDILKAAKRIMAVMELDTQSGLREAKETGTRADKADRGAHSCARTERGFRPHTTPRPTPTPPLPPPQLDAVASGACMCLLWALRLQPLPQVSWADIRALAPVSRSAGGQWRGAMPLEWWWGDGGSGQGTQSEYSCRYSAKASFRGPAVPGTRT